MRPVQPVRLWSVLQTDVRAQDGLSAAVTLLVGIAMIALGLTEIWSWPGALPTGRPAGWWHVLPLLVGCGAMLVKRRQPAAALAVGLVAVTADVLLGGSVGMLLVLFDLLYAAGQFGPARLQRPLVVGVSVAIGLASLAYAVRVGEPRVFVLVALQLVAVLVVPLWWAANVRQKSELADLAADRARLERARATDLERIAEMARHEAVQAERGAMARDLHDVIASHLSATAIHSGAALALPVDSARDRRALEAVRASSLRALEEMRSMIMLLRSDLVRPGEVPADGVGTGGNGDQVTAAARLDRLEDLVERTREQGTEIILRRTGEGEPPAAVEQAAYRIIAESITNATKHAPGAVVDVDVHGGEHELSITVINPLSDPAGPGGPDPTPGSGTGLWSMRERAAALGGQLTAGPQAADDPTGPDRWTVSCALPYLAAGSAAGGRS